MHGHVAWNTPSDHYRQLVEIPSNQANPRDSSPEKGKAPKKKPRTITDLVTEQYASKDAEPNPNDSSSNFFDSRASTTTTKVPLNDTSTADGKAVPKKPARRRNSSKSGTEKERPTLSQDQGKHLRELPLSQSLLQKSYSALLLQRRVYSSKMSCSEHQVSLRSKSRPPWYDRSSSQ